jgi:hypothetical protein
MALNLLVKACNTIAGKQASYLAGANIENIINSSYSAEQ